MSVDPAAFASIRPTVLWGARHGGVRCAGGPPGINTAALTTSRKTTERATPSTSGQIRSPAKESGSVGELVAVRQ